MFDELVGYLNNLRAGDVLIFICVVGWVIVTVTKYAIKVRKMHRDAIVEDINKDTEYTNLVNGLSKTQEELKLLKENIGGRFQTIQEKLDREMQESSGGDEVLQSAVKELEEVVAENDARVSTLETTVEHIREQIELLFRSDKEYFKAYIIDGYNKYVKEEHEIPLIALQTLESIYNKYLNDNDSQNDEFIARIMKELRNLPTSRDA